MENIVLAVHLLLALALILSVLLQRSEGGGLGIGGGGGGAMSGRAPTSPVARLTWILAIGFLVTSLALTWIAAQNSAGRSVIDRVGTGDAPIDAPALPPGLEGSLLPPAPSDEPTAPPLAEPAAPAQ